MLPLLKAISDETRLKLLHLLLRQDLCGRALAQRLGVTNAAVSQHLKILRNVGLINAEKRGYWTHYTVRKEAIEHIIAGLTGLLRQAALPIEQCRRIDAVSLPEKEVKHMCCGPCCQQPTKLKGKPGECTPDQIRECHGEEPNHPCQGEKTEVKDLQGR